ncbi:putative multiprotein-bridging factor 1b-like [Capsicum annuum]|nr:putative multiprotein-bridging factor 1b-like [Capsicum annuum]
MQGSIYSRCFRAGELLFHKAEIMILNYIPCRPLHSQALKPANDHAFDIHQYRIPTRHYSSTNKRNPWDSSRTTSTGFTQIKAFVSDFPAKNPKDGMPNGHAMFSTSSSDDGSAKKPVVKKEETEAAAKSDHISDARIISTLAKYLWMKDNFEFRFRVIAALSLLVGAKVDVNCSLLVALFTPIMVVQSSQHRNTLTSSVDTIQIWFRVSDLGTKVVALALQLLGRLLELVVNVQVPFLFKLAVDWLTTATGNASALAEFTTANSTALAFFASPAAVLIGYGIARSGASAFNELRTAIFSKVALRTIRSVSRKGKFVGALTQDPIIIVDDALIGRWSLILIFGQMCEILCRNSVS